MKDFQNTESYKNQALVMNWMSSSHILLLWDLTISAANFVLQYLGIVISLAIRAITQEEWITALSRLNSQSGV